MSIRTAPPFRGDHVGSLLRPPELLRARDDFAEGRIGFDAIRPRILSWIGHACHAKRRVALGGRLGTELSSATTVSSLGGCSARKASKAIWG